MNNEIDKETTKNRKFICRNHLTCDEDDMCRYIDEHIGCFPDEYEIISLVVKNNYFYVFFKQYIE